MDFFAKLEAAIIRNDSLLCVGLDPVPEQIPARYRSGNDLSAILAWSKAVIEETQDLVCIYKPNIAFYEALGQPGQELLREVLALIPDHLPTLLDVKRGDVGSTAAAYARACFEELEVDAVTLSPYLGRDSVDPFAAYPKKGLFVLCHTSNPSAGTFQHLEISDWRSLDRHPNERMFLHVAREATSWSPNVGLVVGATYPEALRSVREISPASWILVPGIGAQGGDLAATLDAGLRPDGMGLIISASRGVCLADNHRQAAEQLRSQINLGRSRTPDSLTVPAAQPGTGADSTGEEQLRTLIIGLADLGAIKFGDFTLASGARAPFYIDLRLLVSRPELLTLAADLYANQLQNMAYDRVAGVPYAALPIGTALSMVSGVPLIYPRKEAKAHGLGQDIEGLWQAGERIVIIEDLITSGGSIIKSATKLREVGLIVQDAIVLIDREQGGIEELAAAGIAAHPVMRLRQVLDMLVSCDRLPPAKHAEVLDYLDA